MNEREQFLENRKTGIGGSDVGAILGVSRFKSAVDVWLQKMGQAEPQEENSAMFWGTTLEPVIRAQYANKTGKSVMQPDMIRSDEHKFMIANLDGVVPGDRIVEIKTARTSDGWGDPFTDEIPLEYNAQVQHYMIVTGLQLADVAVLIGGSDFRIYTVQADKALHEAIIEKERAFWQLVVDGVMPEPQSAEDVSKLFAKDNGESIEADSVILDEFTKLKALREQKKQIESGIELVEDFIKRQFRDASALTYNGQTLATWKASKDSQRFDVDAFKSAHPDIFMQYQKTQPGSRRFLIK